MQDSNPTQALRDWAVINTRPALHATELSAALAAHGAVVVEHPLLEITPGCSEAEVTTTLAGLSSADWLWFTSASAVFAVGAPVEKTAARIAAIGKGTAEKLREFGRSPDFIANDSTAEGMLSEFQDQHPIAAKHVLAIGNTASTIIERGLSGSTRWEVYLSSPISFSAAQIAQLVAACGSQTAAGKKLAVVLTSALSAQQWLRLGITCDRVVAIGRKTASALSTSSVPVIVAEQPTNSAVILALIGTASSSTRS